MSTDEMNSLRGEFQSGFQDLKQFLVREFAIVNGRLDRVEARVAGLERRMDGLETRMENLETRIGSLETNVADLTAWVTEAIDTTNETHAAQFKDYSMRLAFLEHKTA